jgi:hypothetical protein
MTDSRAYLHKALQLDPQLGYVEVDGRVFEARFGPDKPVGRVELATGKVFESRFGPDKLLGRVDLTSGKIYRHVPGGPDEYLADTDRDGNFFVHVPLAPDHYVGNVTPMPGYAHAGAAFLLLLWPALEKEAGRGEGGA